MIGHLQRNKVKYIAPFVYLIHGADSKKLLDEINKQAFVINYPHRLTPFAFPLWAESLRTQVSTESWGDRVRKMAEDLENTN